ncbi:hypothetical protein, partial [Pseudovibrio sp. W74]|uniref:hypothetical protein n=1 Tax=Pseudovibrio sp. W74 TaxID=1735584 RepID=UPI0019D3AC62
NQSEWLRVRDEGTVLVRKLAGISHRPSRKLAIVSFRIRGDVVHTKMPGQGDSQCRRLITNKMRRHCLLALPSPFWEFHVKTPPDISSGAKAVCKTGRLTPPPSP